MKKTTIIFCILISATGVFRCVSAADEISNMLNIEFDERFHVKEFFNNYYEDALDFLDRWPNMEDQPKEILKKIPVLKEYGDLVFEEMFDFLFDFDNFNQTQKEITKLYEKIVSNPRIKSGMPLHEVAMLFEREVDKGSFTQIQKDILKRMNIRQERIKEFRETIKSQVASIKKVEQKKAQACAPKGRGNLTLKDAFEFGFSVKEALDYGFTQREIDEFKGIKQGEKAGKGKAPQPSSQHPQPKTAAATAGSSQLSESASRPFPVCKASSKSGASARAKSPGPVGGYRKFRKSASCILSDNPSKSLSSIAPKAKPLLELFQRFDSINEIGQNLTPGAKLEKMKGGENYWSIRINEKMRILFQTNDESSDCKIFNITVVDYH